MSRPVRIVFIGLLACLLGGVSSMSAVGVSPQAASNAPQSRTTISGTVVNASLTPLAGAIVTLEQGTRVVAKATTDAKGAFRFTGISAGEYTVQTALAGFPTSTRTLKVPAGKASLTLPIVLSKPGEALQESTKVAVDGVNRQMQQGQAVALPPPPPAATPVLPPRAGERARRVGWFPHAPGGTARAGSQRGVCSRIIAVSLSQRI